MIVNRVHLNHLAFSGNDLRRVLATYSAKAYMSDVLNPPFRQFLSSPKIKMRLTNIAWVDFKYVGSLSSRQEQHFL